MGELCEGLRCWLPLSLYYIEGVGILTVGTIGLAINLAAMKLLVCAKPRHIFHHVLLSLTIYDFLQVREHPKETILMLPFSYTISKPKTVFMKSFPWQQRMKECTLAFARLDISFI